MTASIHQLKTESFDLIGKELERIPEGAYSVRYKSHATAKMFNSGRLIVRFEVVSGKYSGVQIENFYPVNLIGEVGKGGGFSVTRRSFFFRDFVRATNHLPERLDRMPLSRLRGRTILARVKTVTKDHERDLLPECCQYSRISKLLSGECS